MQATGLAATGLGILVLMLLVVSVVLSALVHQLSVLGTGPIVPVVLIYAGVGVIVARRQPRNPIGWILLISIALLLFSADVGSSRGALLSPRPSRASASLGRCRAPAVVGARAAAVPGGDLAVP